jgi:beta-N-acetylhexosaminidase
MTLTTEQAVGQKLLLSFEGTEPSPEVLTTIRRQHIGGVTLFRAANVESPAQVRELTAALQRVAGASGQPPLLIATDQEGGQLMAISGTTLFPGNMALGATGFTELARRTGQALGRELAAMGVNVNYAPACDVNSNPQNPVIGIRSFGEDPARVAQMCAAMVKGLQEAGVAATAKHFPGHGDASGDSHYGTPVQLCTRERLDQVELPPFQATIEAGVCLVMSAHLAFPNLTDDVPLPATLSSVLLRELLRDDLGFEGVIVSDAMDMKAIWQGPGLIVDAIAAMKAGVDLLLLVGEMESHRTVYAALVQAVERTLLSSSQMIASAGRVLALKQWLAGKRRPSLDVVGCVKHRDLALETAARSITLVRDEASLLPLRLSADARLAVVVPQSVDLTPADTSSYVECALAESLRRYHPSVDEFVVPHAPSDTDVAVLRERICDYDMVVVGTVNASVQPGQAALMRAVLETGVPTIAVALRLPCDLQAYPKAPTYLCTYGILRPSMDALADAIVGEISFRGRLPVSIPGLYPVGYRDGADVASG